MFVSILDQIVRIRTASSTANAGLHDVMNAAASGSLIDLPGMRADQRGPVVTCLAILTHLIRRYEGRVPEDASGWAAALRRQLGPDALTLAGGPDDRPAFLQPVLAGLGELRPLDIGEVDHLMPAARHVLKGTVVAPPEAALYALMASTWRQHGGATHNAGARQREMVVLVGDGLTIASEIAALAAAYDAMRPRIAGSEAPSTGSAADHMLWLLPWRDAEPISRLPWPLIDCRRVRVVPADDGMIGAISVASVSVRVAVGSGDVEDPHAPTMADGAPYRVVAGRRWTHIVQHCAVAGSPKVRRAPIMDLVPSYRSVRICAVGYATGKSLGYWEATYRLGRPRRRLISTGLTDRLADLSARALAVVSAAGTALYAPMVALHTAGAVSMTDYANRAGDQLRHVLGHASLQLVLDMVDDDPDAPHEQRRLHAMAAAGIRAVWADAVTVVPDLLRVARAQRWLDFRVHAAFQENIVSETTGTDLGRRTMAVLYQIGARMTPGDRASIRGAATALPLAAYIALAAAPAAETSAPASLRAWESAVRALAVLHQGGPPVGAVLAATNYPEARMSTLLAATGGHLCEMIDEATRWLVAHDVARADMTGMITMGLADAAGDEPGRREAAVRVALAYGRVRNEAVAA